MKSRRIIAPLLFAALLPFSANGDDSRSVDPNNARGLQTDKIFAFGDLDSINTFNGNVLLQVPIGQSYSVRPGFEYQFVLTYNSKVWDFSYIADEPPPGYAGSPHQRIATPETDSNAGLGWSLSLGRVLPPRPATPTTPYRGYVYLSPDGGRHELWSDLRSEFHWAVEPPKPFTLYSTDSTYIRATIGLSEIVLEFPDGLTRTFFGSADNFGHLKKIEDRYGNWVQVEYGLGPDGADIWKIKDGFGPPSNETIGRTHTVEFERSNDYSSSNPNFERRIKAVILAGPDNRNATTYSFQYRRADIQKGTCGSYLWAAGSVWGDPPPTVSVPLLTSITLPDGTSLGAEYFREDNPICSSGSLRQLMLPTGGQIRWEYGEYESAAETCSSPDPDNASRVTEWSYRSPGVTKRIVVNGDQQAIWTYAPVLERGAPIPSYSCGENFRTQNAPPQVFTNTVTDPLGNSTIHYFSAFRADAAAFNSFPSRRREFGLPLIRVRDSKDGLFLSQRTSDATRNPLREVRVNYEGDVWGANESERMANPRLQAERTTFLDDAGCGSDIPCFLQTERHDFDGFGHFRRESTCSNFNGAPTAGCAGAADRRETVVNFNPALSPSTPPQTVPNWLLGTYTHSSVTERGITRTTYVTFDDGGSVETISTGSLPGDLLEASCRDARGFVTTQWWLGGDDLTPPHHPCSGTTRRTGEYKLVHTYAFTGAALTSHTARYEGVPFLGISESLDANTGLVTTSADVAGHTTLFSYDAMGRAIRITPPGEEATIYTYTPASGGNLTPARLVVTTGTGESRVENTTVFDSLGRPRLELSRMPGGKIGARQKGYDQLGNMVEISEFESLSAADSVFQPKNRTTTTWDLFGRPLMITGPDGSRTANVYNGVRMLTRTRAFAAPDNQNSSVQIRETFDARGRLVSVTENEGRSDAETTTYTYDVGGELASVSTASPDQPARTFTHDHRGLLISERHPESGLTRYTYDARRLLRTRTSPLRTLTYTYDGAGRRTRIFDGLVASGQEELNLDKVIHETSYDGLLGTAYRTLGRPDFSIRHNRNVVPNRPDIAVRETYTYDGVGGRVSRKATTIDAGPGFDEAYTYTAQGQLLSVAYPGCASCGDLTPPARTITNSYTSGLLTSIAGYASDVTYHPNTLLRSVHHVGTEGSVGPLYEQCIEANCQDNNDLARPVKIRVTSFCEDLSVSAQPPATQTVALRAPANLTVDVTGATTWQWYETLGGSSTAIPDQTTSTLTIPIDGIRSFFLRAGNGICTVDSATTTFSPACSATATITAGGPTTFCEGGTVILTASSGSSWLWSTGATTQTISVNTSGEYTVLITTPNGCTATSAPVTVAVRTRPEAIVSASGSTTFPQGGQVTLTASGGESWIWSTGASARSIVVSSSGAYSVTVTASSGCSRTSPPVTIVVVPPPPAAVTATAASGSRVDLTWAAGPSEPVVRFEIYRGSRGTSQLIGTSITTAFSDLTAAPQTAYVYRLRTITAAAASDMSAPDLATTVLFSDDPLTAGVSLIRAAHVDELRVAVNAIRSMAGLPAAVAAPLISRLTLVRASDVEGLRTSLNEARVALGWPMLSFTEASLATGVIKRIHIEELRGGVK